LTIILCVSFIWVTNCSIRVSQSFTGGVAVLCLPGLLHLYDCDYEIYNIAHSLIIDCCWWAHSYLDQNNRTLAYLSSEKKTLRHQLCSTYYAAVRINNCFKKNFCNQSSHYENYGWFNGSHHVSTTKSTLFMVNKDEWYTKEGPWRMHCMYSGMAKGTSWAEATLNSEKIRPVGLAIVELCESEGIRQLVSQ